MVDTREVFAGLDTYADLALWKRRLDEMQPELPSSTSTTSTSPTLPASSSSSTSSSSSSSCSGSADVSKGKRRGRQREGEDADDEATGPYYDEGADLKDELWVSRKYLSHQPAVAQQLEQHRQQHRRQLQQQKDAERRRQEHGDLPPHPLEQDAGGGGADLHHDQAAKRKKARPEDWTSERDDPLTKPRQSDATLSCPCCFTPLCYDCQRHEVYVNQYRAMFVTDECETRTGEVRTYEGDRYHPVFCSTCGTEVGVFEPADEIYHFFNTIPGN